MLKTKLSLLALAIVFVSAQTAFAQHNHSNTHIDYVPHTTTHTDVVQHGNHLHAVPHTTTHVDAVPHTTYQPYYQNQTLGIDLGEKWTNQTIKFEKGHRLLLTTDGVTEASNPQQVPFGRDRLKSMLHGGQDLSAKEFVKSVQDAVLSHQQINQTQDDVTILLLENTTSGKLQKVA